MSGIPPLVGTRRAVSGIHLLFLCLEIGYLLFHTRKDEGQRLFALTEEPVIKYPDELTEDVYKNIKDSQLYILASLNQTEMDCTNIHASYIKQTEQSYRYDPQFATIEELTTQI